MIRIQDRSVIQILIVIKQICRARVCTQTSCDEPLFALLHTQWQSYKSLYWKLMQLTLKLQKQANIAPNVKITNILAKKYFATRDRI